MEQRRVKPSTAQVPRPLEQWNLLHSHSSQHSPLAASPIPSCASHIAMEKNKPTNQRTSVRKQIQVPVADWAGKED